MRRCRRGQSTVELALVLPVLAAMALLLVQVGLVLRAQVLVVHAAREAARVVAVSNDPARAAQAAAQSSGLDPRTLVVAVDGSAEPGTNVTVSVRHDFVTDVPLVGSLLGDVHLTAQVTMLAEG